MRHFHTEAASPMLLGDRPISTRAWVAALDCTIDEMQVTTTAAETDMVIDYAAARFEKGECDGAAWRPWSRCSTSPAAVDIASR